jgi:hypothetical protein
MPDPTTDNPLTEAELWDAMDGMHAYDTGCVDSGIRDEVLRHRVKVQMRGMPDDERRMMLARLFRDNYLTDEAISQGYGLEDAADFWRWLDEDMGCAL